MHTFVGRQPVFDLKMNIFGYELLFRTGLDNYFPQVDGDEATSNVISDSYFNIGINTITQGSRAFINFTRNTLLDDYAMLLPKENLVVEILEDVEPDAEVIQAVKRLKQNGYTIALDDIEKLDEENPLVELADIIKVDFMRTTQEEQQALADSLKKRKIRLLAEKVETHEEFEEAKKMGYTLFQGYFFCKPSIIQKKRIPEMKLNRLRLLEAVNQPELDFEKVEALAKQDVSFSYKLLKYINSAYFGLRQEATNIRQALVLMGQKNLRKWVSLMIYTFLGENKPPELLVTAIVRGRFCELMAEPFGIKERESDLFLMGMFSTIDAILDMPMDKLLDDIPLAVDIKAALLSEPSQMLYILEAAIAYEEGNWELFESLKDMVKFDEEVIPKMHLEAMKMAKEVLHLESAEA
jgi:c-di-GMP-related signal transduction protein